RSELATDLGVVEEDVLDVLALERRHGEPAVTLGGQESLAHEAHERLADGGGADADVAGERVDVDDLTRAELPGHDELANVRRHLVAQARPLGELRAWHSLVGHLSPAVARVKQSTRDRTAQRFLA